MSQPSRPRARGPAQQPRRLRRHEIDPIQRLEERELLAPVLSTSFFTVAPNNATTTVATGTGTATIGAVTLTATAKTNSPAPLTTVTELTPIQSFGGDIVRIKAGPGGDFGKGVYAISRGAGENANASNRPAGAPAPINRPGVIYRVDPATGKSSIFFDLNTVINQLEPGGTAANSLGSETGLVNWYDMTFDNEGYFDGRPSLFVSSVDRSDPNKNAIYRIAPDGTFLGAFAQFTAGAQALKFNVAPSAILTPPPEQQSFLRGLLVGRGTPTVTASTTPTTGVTTTGGQTTTATGVGAGIDFRALFFDANVFRPGQNLSSATSLPNGVTETPLAFGPQVGLTAANTNYVSPAYSVFTNFGTPAAGGIPARPGLSGVQGLGGSTTTLSTTAVNGTGTTTNTTTITSAGADLGGELLIRNAPATATTNTTITVAPATIFDINNPGTQATLLGTQPSATTPGPVDQFSVISTPFRRFQDIAFDQYGYFSYDAGLPTGTGTGTGATAAPTYQGSVFVSDLATGLAISATIPALPAVPGVSPATATQTIAIPIQGPGSITVQAQSDGTVAPVLVNGNSTGGNLGGRILRIGPNGLVETFAQNFHTSGSQTSQSFLDSELSITFSADGTTLYASDDDGIWQFKTVASLAGSTSGSIVGLNDLRTLGVPYEGQNSAVAIVDTGVDNQDPAFRGHVAPGTNILFNGSGNSDSAPGQLTSGNNGTQNTTNSSVSGFVNGHGTLLGGVVAQFVPQATLEPVNVFAPTLSSTINNNNNVGNGTNGTTPTPTTVNTSPDILYQGLQYTADHPLVADPIRPNKQDRVVAATFGFGTTQTFPTEVAAYKKFPQFTIALKNQFHRFRSLGITPIAAAGQFGSPNSTNNNNTNGTNGTNGTTNTTTAPSDINGMSLPAVFNEVVSVTGTYPFPIQPGPTTSPLVDNVGLLGQFPPPFLITTGPSTGNGNGTTVGGGLNGGGTTGTTTGSTTSQGVGPLTADDATIFKDKLLSTVNRSILTDFAAPALDVPTFRRAIAVAALQQNTNTTNTNGVVLSPGAFGLSTGNDPSDLDFTEAGTSLSAAITTGSFALTASALDYWDLISKSGSTVDAYLTMPVGARSLNFGPNTLKDLSAYANPDGVNAILQWTAAPAIDNPNTYADALSNNNNNNNNNTGGVNGTNTTTTTPTVPRLFGSASPRSYSRISVGNAIAAIEGTIALDYLFKHGIFNIIDSNHDGLITAQKIQNFVDSSASMGLPEAGAMARLLGGTARIPGQGNPTTSNGGMPDQPDVLQRRFNFFDYAANGRLAGVVSLDTLKQLSQKLLPKPDDFTIIDRQRSSSDRYLLNPAQPRATQDLQHLLPTNEFIPASKIAKYRGVSPQGFHIGRSQGHFASPFTVGPTFTLFDHPTTTTVRHAAVHQAASHPTSTTTPAPQVKAAAAATTTLPAAAGATGQAANVVQQSPSGSAGLASRVATIQPQKPVSAATPTAPVTPQTDPSTTSASVGATTATPLTTDASQTPSGFAGSPTFAGAGPSLGSPTPTGNVQPTTTDASPAQVVPATTPAATAAAPVATPKTAAVSGAVANPANVAQPAAAKATGIKKFWNSSPLGKLLKI